MEVQFIGGVKLDVIKLRALRSHQSKWKSKIIGDDFLSRIDVPLLIVQFGVHGSRGPLR